MRLSLSLTTLDSFLPSSHRLSPSQDRVPSYIVRFLWKDRFGAAGDPWDHETASAHDVEFGHELHPPLEQQVGGSGELTLSELNFS